MTEARSKNKGGAGSPGPSPGSATDVITNEANSLINLSTKEPNKSI